MLGSIKRQVSRRKHWPLNVNVQLPKTDEVLKLETNTQLKVKQLKELIKQRAPAQLENIANIERIQLQIEGGEILKKSTAQIDDAGVKDNCTIIVTILEKGAGGASSTQANRERKAAKDEPKVPIIYTLRNQYEVTAQETEANEDISEIINTSSKIQKAGEERVFEV